MNLQKCLHFSLFFFLSWWGAECIVQRNKTNAFPKGSEYFLYPLYNPTLFWIAVLQSYLTIQPGPPANALMAAHIHQPIVTLDILFSLDIQRHVHWVIWKAALHHCGMAVINWSISPQTHLSAKGWRVARTTPARRSVGPERTRCGAGYGRDPQRTAQGSRYGPWWTESAGRLGWLWLTRRGDCDGCRRAAVESTLTCRLQDERQHLTCKLWMRTSV